MRFLFLALFALGATAHKTYDGYKVYRTTKLNSTHSEALRKIQTSSNFVDFWTEPSVGRRADMMIQGDMASHLEKYLKEHGIKFHAMIEDVESVVQEVETSRRMMRKTAKKTNKDYDLDWNDYYDHDTLNQFLDSP